MALTPNCLFILWRSLQNGASLYKLREFLLVCPDPYPAGCPPVLRVLGVPHPGFGRQQCSSRFSISRASCLIFIRLVF